MKVTYCQECNCSLYAEPIGDTHDSTVPAEGRIEYVYYKTRGESYSEVKQNALRFGPLVPQGGRSVSYTEFRLRWKYNSKYQISRSDSRNTVVLDIEFTSIRILVSHKVTMPMLDDGVRLPSQDADLWNQYVEKLRQHELDHVTLSSHSPTRDALKTAIGAVKKIEFGFDELPETIDSSAGEIIALAVNAVGNKYIALIRKQYELLDSLTRYGEVDYNREEILRKVFGA